MTHTTLLIQSRFTIVGEDNYNTQSTKDDLQRNIFYDLFVQLFGVKEIFGIYWSVIEGLMSLLYPGRESQVFTPLFTTVWHQKAPK